MSELEMHVRTMLEVPPSGWWRFINCRDCCSRRGEECLKGGDAWPEPLHRPHKSRYRAGLMLHGVIWLLGNGHAEDVLFPIPPTPGRSRAVGAESE